MIFITIYFYIIYLITIRKKNEWCELNAMGTEKKVWYIIICIFQMLELVNVPVLISSFILTCIDQFFYQILWTAKVPNEYH